MIAILTIMCLFSIVLIFQSYLYRIQLPYALYIHAYLQRYTTFNISSIIGAATSYTINFTNADTGKSCGSAPISATSCTNGSCEHDFLISSSTCPRQANLSVTIFGSNKLGDGRMSNPIKRGI